MSRAKARSWRRSLSITIDNIKELQKDDDKYRRLRSILSHFALRTVSMIIPVVLIVLARCVLKITIISNVFTAISCFLICIVLIAGITKSVIDVIREVSDMI